MEIFIKKNTRYEQFSDCNCFEYKNYLRREKTPDHGKYITTQEFNKLIAKRFAVRLKQTDLVNKTDFDNKLTSFNRRITSNKTKHLKLQKKLNSLTKHLKLQKKLNSLITKD